MKTQGHSVRAAGVAAARPALFVLVPACIAAMPLLVSKPWLSPFAAVDGLMLASSISWGRQAGLRVLLRAAATAALALACLVFVAGGVLPRLGLYRPVTVYSNSMQPTFNAGDMIVVTRKPTSEVRIGDVITYAIPIGDRHTESHRIVKIIKVGTHPVVVTKGDANHDMDPWNARLTGSSVWVYRERIPYLGYAVIWLRMPFVRVLCLVMLPLLLAGVAVGHIWGYRIVRHEAHDHAPAL